MKKISLLFFVILILVSRDALGQYRINKTKYYPRNYFYVPGDPYKPSSAVFASVVIPGLGQMTCNEPVRGIGFFLGWGGSLGCSFAGLTIVSNTEERDPGFEDKMKWGTLMYLSGLVGATVFWIWSFTDASKVAKVNNLAFRDRKRLSGNLSLKSYVDFRPSQTNYTSGIGLSAKFNF